MAPAHAWTDHMSANTGPWFRTHPGFALATVALLYAGVLALRLALDNPLDAISMLYVFPVALVAMTGGRWVGLAGGILSVVLVAVWVLAQSVDLTVVGWLSRALPLMMVGFLIGDANDRLEHASQERQARLLAVQRQREAVEINDSLVQGMSAAKWSIEAGRVENGLQVLAEAVELGHQLVSELIRDSGAGPTSVPADGTKVPGTGDARP
jgi:K+-sensing histidine kinase KdpD